MSGGRGGDVVRQLGWHRTVLLVLVGLGWLIALSTSSVEGMVACGFPLTWIFVTWPTNEVSP